MELRRTVQLAAILLFAKFVPKVINLQFRPEATRLCCSQAVLALPH